MEQGLYPCSYWFLQVPTSSYWFLLVPTGSYRFLQIPVGSSRFFWVPAGSPGFLQVPRGPARVPQHSFWPQHSLLCDSCSQKLRGLARRPLLVRLDPPCTNSTPSTLYLNNQYVRAALHISPKALDWVICR